MGKAGVGTYVISWSQTELDGLPQAPLTAARVGASWSWSGEAVRVDGPVALLTLVAQPDDGNLRRSAARMVRRLVGAAITGGVDPDRVEVDDPLFDAGFVLTDGHRTYAATLIEVGPKAPPLLMFLDAMPEAGRDFWIVHEALRRQGQPQRAEETAGGVICFTHGTRISTPNGPRPVEALREGDRVLTKDNGPQPVQWIGARRMTGARLHSMPHLRPIRIRPGAFGIRRPEESLLVSPEHRMLVSGAVSRELFNAHEVLVTARDLENGRTIVRDLTVTEVTYVHLLLDAHQIVFANGVETESFHPANAALSALTPADRDRLLRGMPELEYDPHHYGAYARRNLSRPEAAILQRGAA